MQPFSRGRGLGKPPRAAMVCRIGVFSSRLEQPQTFSSDTLRDLFARFHRLEYQYMVPYHAFEDDSRFPVGNSSLNSNP